MIEWGRNPDALKDEGLEPPSTEIIQRAVSFAKDLQQLHYPPPTSVYPDPNGGIVFELRHGDVSEKIHFWDDGGTDYARFQDTNLVERRPLQ